MNLRHEHNAAIGDMADRVLRLRSGEIVADELGADWSRVSIDHVDSDPKWGFMVTGGSWSVFTSFTQLSQAGAAGRTVLIDAAAKLVDLPLPGEAEVLQELIAIALQLTFRLLFQAG